VLSIIRNDCCWRISYYSYKQTPNIVRWWKCYLQYCNDQKLRYNFATAMRIFMFRVRQSDANVLLTISILKSLARAGFTFRCCSSKNDCYSVEYNYRLLTAVAASSRRNGARAPSSEIEWGPEILEVR
jgi:hypothetical protein